MNRENEHDYEDLSENLPEISAIEAALAQLRPLRKRRFADEVKGRLKDALSGKAAESQNPTVKIPLTHYIRMAQFNAAAGGLLAGLFLGVLLGGACVFITLNRSETRQRPPAAFPARLPYAWLENDPSLTPQEQVLLDQLYKESYRGRR